jgi:hypothetical protein
MGAHAPGKQSAKNRADRGGNFKKHADADVGEALAHIGSRRARGCGDDRDERCADGVLHVDAERQRERGHNDHSAAKAGKRAQKPARKERIQTTAVKSHAVMGSPVQLRRRRRRLLRLNGG